MYGVGDIVRIKPLSKLIKLPNYLGIDDDGDHKFKINFGEFFFPICMDEDINDEPNREVQIISNDITSYRILCLKSREEWNVLPEWIDTQEPYTYEDVIEHLNNLVGG